MDNDHGITGELRQYASYAATYRFRQSMLDIADRIDAAHERAVMSVMNDALYHANDENMAELGWVRLPKDADGKYIHVGDMLEITHGFGTKDCGEVTDIHLQSGKCAVSIGFGDEEGVTAYPEDYRHYHAPTVEDVLREFGKAWVEWEDGSPYDPIAKFSAKLRLAGDAE